jgi:hypothetical protein
MQKKHSRQTNNQANEKKTLGKRTPYYTSNSLPTVTGCALSVFVSLPPSRFFSLSVFFFFFLFFFKFSVGLKAVWLGKGWRQLLLCTNKILPSAAEKQLCQAMPNGSGDGNNLDQTGGDLDDASTAATSPTGCLTPEGCHFHHLTPKGCHLHQKAKRRDAREKES